MTKQVIFNKIFKFAALKKENGSKFFLAVYVVRIQRDGSITNFCTHWHTSFRFPVYVSHCKPLELDARLFQILNGSFILLVKRNNCASQCFDWPSNGHFEAYISRYKQELGRKQ